MPPIKAMKQSIKSVKNTSQITKAMEVVSATKMRKAQNFTMCARPFAVASLELLQNLLSRTPVLPPLLQARPVKTSLLLVVTSDKGLAGAFNANVLNLAEKWTAEKKKNGANFSLVAVGKRARDYFERRNTPILKSFVGFGDYSTFEETSPMAEEVLKAFLSGQIDEAEAAYTSFRTTLRQEATLKKILPVTKEGIQEIVRSILPESGRYAETEDRRPHTAELSGFRQETRYSYEYKFEPSPAEILNILGPRLLQMHVHHIVLESNASEHSARMVAMKNASDNAKELTASLRLIYNKARQTSITKELTEITAGREALEQ